MILTTTTPRAPRARLAAIGALTVVALGLTACTGDSNTFGGSGDVNTVSSDTATSIDGAVQSAMELSGSTQAIVGVWNSEGAYVRAYGEGDIDGGTRFNGAQATRPIVCALLLDAVERGEVALDQKVSETLPRQTGIDDVTYEQLCTMRSGLADYKSAFADIFANNPTRPWSEQELIAQGLSDSPKPWPGLDFHRSDTNLVLLGRALRINSHDTLQSQLQDRVFGPADMGSSYFPEEGATSIVGDSMTALTYPSQGGKPVCEAGALEVTEVSTSMLAGAGATVTTAEDLKNFYEFYLTGGFGPADTESLITDTVSQTNPEHNEDGTPKEEVAEPEPGDTTWGFGTEKVGPLYGLSGAVTGTLTAAYHDPASGTTVVIALNNSSAGAALPRALALQLATLSGLETPWTVEDQQAAIAERAVCQSE